MASSSADSSIKIWKLNNGKLEQTASFGVPLSTIISIIQLRDERLAAASGDGKIRIFNLHALDAEDKLSGHQGGVTNIFQLNNLDYLVSTSRDGTLRVWDLKEGDEPCVNILRGHTASVLSVTQLKSGHLVSASADKTLRIWETNTGSCLKVLVGHKGEVNAVVQQGDGNLVSVGDDESIKIWTLYPEELRDLFDCAKKEQLLALQQIILLIQLGRLKLAGESVSLHDSWQRAFNDLPDCYKKMYTSCII